MDPLGYDFDDQSSLRCLCHSACLGINLNYVDAMIFYKYSDSSCKYNEKDCKDDEKNENI